MHGGDRFVGRKMNRYLLTDRLYVYKEGHEQYPYSKNVFFGSIHYDLLLIALLATVFVLYI